MYVVVYSGWEVTHASYVRLIKRKSIGPDPFLGVFIGSYQPQGTHPWRSKVQAGPFIFHFIYRIYE